ncbi:uncharacterized protein [Solanum tuberosum]|uniref:uncharacterized protein n=1 Tax=Solanum tuberosum TaxID=4113 RepID=UPI00073A066B|nr:PREDICTED: uncharacterized protein LOC107057956 [Solanum tuberosum]
MESMDDRNVRTNKELLEIKQAIGGMNQRDKELDNCRGESSAGGDNSKELRQLNTSRDIQTGVTGNFLTRCSRLDFPRFSRQDLKTWLYKVDQFFSMYEIPYSQRVKVTSIHLDGEAIAWQRSYIKARNTAVDPTWTEYILALNEAADWVNLSNENAISCFLGGVKLELNKSVRMQARKTLMQAYKLARLQEEVFEAQAQSWGIRSSGKHQNPILPTPNFHRNPNVQRPIPANTSYRKPFDNSYNKPSGFQGNANGRKLLTAAEMDEKRAKGLCFLCDEKYVRGHVCKAKKQLLLVELCEEGDVTMEEDLEPDQFQDQEAIDNIANPEECMTISLQAFTGVTGYQTIRVTGYHEKRPLQILIDTGSTHNFIDEEMARQLGCKASTIMEQSISVADGRKVQTASICRNLQWLLQGTIFSSDFLLLPLGNIDVVLGVQWLNTLGRILFDFSKRTIEFMHQGKKHVSRGATTQVKTTKAKVLNKKPAEQVQFYMLSVNIPVTFQCNHIQAITATGDDIPVVLVSLMEQYKCIFDIPTALPPHRGPYDHIIPIIDNATPISKRPYRFPGVKKDIIKKLVHEMLDQGVVQHSTSPYASPVVLVGKKDGSWRLCIDYRDLNHLTVKDKFPIPIIEDLLDELGGAEVFSKIDLRAGYHQLRMAESDVHKTAFKFHEGHYEFLVMPFGLTNAPSSFQSLMNSVFKPLLRKSVLVFFDDILVYSRTMSAHVDHLRTVFELMKHYQLYAKASKCAFGVTEVEYLGHFISAKGVVTDPKKVRAVQAWELPTTIKELRGFLGLAGYLGGSSKDLELYADLYMTYLKRTVLLGLKKLLQLSLLSKKPWRLLLSWLCQTMLNLLLLRQMQVVQVLVLS